MDPRLIDNRDNWDDRTQVHVRSEFYDVDGWLDRAPGPRARELEALGDVDGLSLVHLQCHFGMDALQFARAGARVTGLDFSPVAIEAARDLAERAALSDRARFVCADVYDAADALDGEQFDVVFVSLGALTWLPTIERWAEQVGALLRPGGRLYLHDCHPLALTFGDEPDTTMALSYFEEDDAHVDESGGTYTDGDVAPISHRRIHEWNHGLGEIVTALIGHGLRIDRLDEHEWTVWARFPWLVQGDDDRWHLPSDRSRIPLTFTLLATHPRGDEHG